MTDLNRDMGRLEARVAGAAQWLGLPELGFPREIYEIQRYLMTDADWLKAILAAIGVIVLAPWVTWISRSAAGAMSRAEHAQLCQERERHVSNDLAEIKKMLQNQDEEATRSRHRMGNRIQELALEIAQLPGYRQLKRTHEDSSGD